MFWKVAPIARSSGRISEIASASTATSCVLTAAMAMKNARKSGKTAPAGSRKASAASAATWIAERP